MTDEEIRRRLGDLEDGWTERKEQGVSTDDIRRALVAFANSTPEGTVAVLFVGVRDDGAITGVENPEKTQKKITKTASEWCYPPIKHTARVLNEREHCVVAILIPASPDRPHFAGPAFVRVGCQSPKASPEMFEELVARSRSQQQLRKHIARLVLQLQYCGAEHLISVQLGHIREFFFDNQLMEDPAVSTFYKKWIEPHDFIIGSAVSFGWTSQQHAEMVRDLREIKL